MIRQENIREYIIPTVINESVFSARFPNVPIRPIGPDIYVISLSEADSGLLPTIRADVGIVAEPVLYGLNANEALQASNILTFHDYPYGELRGTGTLIGIVDTGIDYTNILFKYEDNTTRIRSIWDQTIEGNPPDRHRYGTVYSEEQINEALRAADPYSIVPSRDEIGHGTFLAGVAAGDDRSSNGQYTGAAPDAGIVVVKLRQASAELKSRIFIAEGEVAYQDIDIIGGISFLLEEADRLGAPLAILIGLGNNFGSHDGNAILERFLNNLTLYAGLNIVVAAGNEGNAGHHFQGTITTGERVDLEVNIAQGEIGLVTQLWTREADKVTVSINTPIGQIIERVPLTIYGSQTFSFTLQESTITITYDYPDPDTGSQLVVINFNKPIPGIWTIGVYGDYIINGTFDMWLPRLGYVNSNTRFSQPNVSTTLSIPATAPDVIVVGAYDYVDGSVYAASGRGPTTNSVIKPDLIAPGVNVEGPSLSGGYTVYIGTSTAAAITAGACALLLEWGIIRGNLTTMNTRIVRVILIRGANRQRGVIYPNPIEGYGRLNLQNSFALL